MSKSWIFSISLRTYRVRVRFDYSLLILRILQYVLDLLMSSLLIIEFVGRRVLDYEVNKDALVVDVVPVDFSGIDKVHFEIFELKRLIALHCLQRNIVQIPDLCKWSEKLSRSERVLLFQKVFYR